MTIVNKHPLTLYGHGLNCPCQSPLVWNPSELTRKQSSLSFRLLGVGSSQPTLLQVNLLGFPKHRAALFLDCCCFTIGAGNPNVVGANGKTTGQQHSGNKKADREVPVARHRSAENWEAWLRPELPLGHARTSQLTGHQEKENDCLLNAWAELRPSEGVSITRLTGYMIPQPGPAIGRERRQNGHSPSRPATPELNASELVRTSIQRTAVFPFFAFFRRTATHGHSPPFLWGDFLFWFGFAFPFTHSQTRT